MEMFSPSPVDACLFIRLISLAELAAFEADTQTGERKVKDSNRTRNEWKGEELNPKKGEVDSLQLKFSFTLLGMKVKMTLVFWQVFCRLNDGAATKWLLSSVWWSLIVKLFWQRWSWFSNALTAQGVKYCHSCSAAGFTEWCPLVSFWSQCSNNGWQETTVLFQRATVSASGGWMSEDGERYSAVCQENVVCVQFGSFLCWLFCSFGFRSPVCLNVAHCFNFYFVSWFGTTTGLEMTEDTIPLLLNAISMCFIL